MIHILVLVMGFALGLQTLIALSFLLSCITEGERRAAIFAVLQFLGSLAVLVGISELNTLWIYSNRGEIFRENWEDWGKEIAVNHPFAIVFAAEMHLEVYRCRGKGRFLSTPNCGLVKSRHH